MKVTSVLRVVATGVNITTGAVSASATLPNNAAGTKRHYLVTASVAAHVRFGAGAQTAVATDLMVVPGEALILDLSGFDTAAAIQDTAAGTVNITPIEM